MNLQIICTRFLNGSLPFKDTAKIPCCKVTTLRTFLPENIEGQEVNANTYRKLAYIIISANDFGAVEKPP
jgi:hypothetical protein